MLMWSQILAGMPRKFENHFEPSAFMKELEEHGNDLGDLSGWMFKSLVLYIGRGYQIKPNGVTGGSLRESLSPEDLEFTLACNTARFAGAQVVTDLANERITHVIVGEDKSGLKPIRETLSR